jgi:hypothetical protein
MDDCERIIIGCGTSANNNEKLESFILGRFGCRGPVKKMIQLRLVVVF